MPLTVRLSPSAERALNSLAKRRGQSRSDIVRDALAQYEAVGEVGPSGNRRPYDAWLDVVGVIDRRVRQPGRTTGDQFTDIVRDKVRARRAR